MPRTTNYRALQTESITGRVVLQCVLNEPDLRVLRKELVVDETERRPSQVDRAGMPGLGKMSAFLSLFAIGPTGLKFVLAATSEGVEFWRPMSVLGDSAIRFLGLAWTEIESIDVGRLRWGIREYECITIRRQGGQAALHLFLLPLGASWPSHVIDPRPAVDQLAALRP
jgi:hypothetical protein